MIAFRIALCMLSIMFVARAEAQPQPLLSVDRHGALVTVEAYASNVVRVTLALDPTQLRLGPGLGIIAQPDPRGWVRTEAPAGADRIASRDMQVTVAPQPWPAAQSMMARYFASGVPPASIAVADGAGRPIVRLTGWNLAPQTVNGERTFRASATFSVVPTEHFYGLGQNQEGRLDLTGRTIDCRHWYDAPSGETVCVPVLVSSANYMIVWDNPSSTLVSPGLHNSTRFRSAVGERVSFFIVTGANADDLYRGYRLLTGATPIPPKAAFGLIQSKARYESQSELLAVAEGYRRRGYPLDMMVLDWFYWTRMGQLDIDRTVFPDPAAMNARLHAWGLHSIVSVWPRFERASRYFDFLAAKGWLLKDASGQPVDGLPVRSDRAGALIDSTNADARAWYWGKIRDNILSQGFDHIWLDETEPDLEPDGFFYAIGSGDRYHNLYPLVHTSVVADGMAKDRPAERPLILARAAYLGAQRNGAIFWTSDVRSTWDALKRQVPANLNMAASGIAYTSSDTGGWHTPSGPRPQRPLLLDPAGAVSTGVDYPDYPELFVRWFQLNTFTPTLRIHGQRPGSAAIWDYGAAAEPILADWLRLRYRLIPYIYAEARRTHDGGAPFMRALFMDFPGDPAVADIGDEYMFGPAFLVAPVLEQGRATRRVYLPAGTDWYDWWSGTKLAGGQWIEAAAPIARIPLYVHAGAIVPLGANVANTSVRQPLAEIRVYPGRDARFALYDDDGTSTAYLTGQGRRTMLRWDEARGRLAADGALPGGQSLAGLVRVVGR